MPCQGVGKVAAQVTRACGYLVVDSTLDVEVLSVSGLYSGDPEEVRKLEQNPLLIIDGCNEKCASHICYYLGVTPAAKVFIIDLMREGGLTPGKTRRELDENGKRLAQAASARVRELIAKMDGKTYGVQKARSPPKDIPPIRYEKKGHFWVPAGRPDINAYSPASSTGRDVCIFPCMGINRPEAIVSQMAAYMVNEDLMPGGCEILCSPAMLSVVEEDVDMVQEMPTIIINGCEKDCASKMYSYLGLTPCAKIDIQDVMKETGITPCRDGQGLDAKGKALSQAVAERVVSAARRLKDPKYPYMKQAIDMHGNKHYPTIDKLMRYRCKGGCWIPEGRPDLD